MSFGYISEVHQTARERLVTVCVMNLLALENLRDANELMNLYKRGQKAKGEHCK